MQVTLELLRDTLDARFHGVLKAGQHSENGENGECCAWELLSAVRGLPWSDEPATVGSWDLRALNDISVSDEVRTTHMLPVLAAYADSQSWPLDRQLVVASRLAIWTVNRVVAGLPGLPAAIADQCRSAQTLADAKAAADASVDAYYNAVSYYAANAAAYAAIDTAYAARAASYAAANAAKAAAYNAAYAAIDTADAADVAAARERAFIAACSMWLDAASEEESP